MIDHNSSTQDVINRILKINEELSRLKDVDAILDRILYEARKLLSADAGSIFLVDADNKLEFSYVHNETLFKDEGTNVEIYKSFAVPINENSIVGYAALTGETLVIDDAYSLPDNLPYSFNSSYDQKTGYHTQSILTIPLKTFQDKLVGVMQLINAQDLDDNVIPFSQESQTYAPLFANNASVAIERGLMTREMILRMMKLAELRDPKETGAHVQRVGAYSAEIYQRWAMNHGVDKKEMQKQKDLIRIAAMLHDVGKVGIPDKVLKKPGKLDDDEYAVMKWHTVFGARLFVNSSSDLDDMCRDIALTHHEKWQGGGYPGKVLDMHSDKAEMGEPKTGEEIPLTGRIVALADVFDALCSKRVYKDPWPEEKVLNILKEDTGTHFDPGVTEAFFQIYDIIKAIQEKYSEHPPEVQ